MTSWTSIGGTSVCTGCGRCGTPPGAPGCPLGRDQVGRLMRIAGIPGVRRGIHHTVTTTRDEHAPRHPDLVKRGWKTPNRPDAVWVADFTYVWTACGFCYVSFIHRRPPRPRGIRDPQPQLLVRNISRGPVEANRASQRTTEPHPQTQVVQAANHGVALGHARNLRLPLPIDDRRSARRCPATYPRSGRSRAVGAQTWTGRPRRARARCACWWPRASPRCAGSRRRSRRLRRPCRTRSGRRHPTRVRCQAAVCCGSSAALGQAVVSS